MKKQIIILSGGGTMGSVMPLVAVWERLNEEFNCVWIGSRRGVEKSFITGLKINYKAITGAKLRRYLSARTIFAPIFVFLGFLESILFLAFVKPKAVVVSGSFVSVPVAWASWILRIPLIVHQEDLQIGFAGRLTIPFANVVTFAFEETMGNVKHKNKFFIGNPVRKIFESAESETVKNKWKNSGLPLILVLGGGLGAKSLNDAVISIASKFVGLADFLLITGKDKIVGNSSGKNYKQIEGLWGADLAEAMTASDVVISRAGLSTMGELGALGKAVIFVPLSGVGQKENAEYFENKGASLISTGEPADLEEKIKLILKNGEKRKELEKNIKNIFPSRAAEYLAEIVKKRIKK